MASYPPPYPPPGGPYGGSPYGMDPKLQRRMLKEQARAQQIAFKAQRAAYKQQARMTLMRAAALRRSSILGPLIVVSLGVVLLLVRMGTLPFDRFAAWYGRWWPLLFVAAGLVLVAEWGFDQMQSSESRYVRRGVGGGVFLLILVLAVTGAIVTGVSHRDRWMRHFDMDSDNFAEFLGDTHQREQTIDQAFPAGTSLSIDNPHGDVTLNGTSTDGQIHIVAYKQVYSQSDSDADQKAEELSPSIQTSEGRMNVTVPTRTGSTVDLTITVPAATAATIDGGHGEIHVTGLKAALSLTANHGDVELNDVQGAVDARVNNRDSSFSAHTITGGVSLKGKADDLNLTSITGAVTLEGDFYGDTHLERITGHTNFRTSRTSLSFARLDGTVDISPEAELTGEQILGPTVLATRSRNITLTRMGGDVNVSDSNGSVEVGSAGPLGDVTVNNRSGSVTLTVPDNAGFAVQAETTGGEIASDFGFSPQQENNRSRLTAKVGSGSSHIFLATTHGDVAVRKGTAAAVESSPMPEPSAKPGKARQGKVGASVSF